MSRTPPAVGSLGSKNTSGWLATKSTIAASMTATSGVATITSLPAPVLIDNAPEASKPMMITRSSPAPDEIEQPTTVESVTATTLVPAPAVIVRLLVRTTS